MIDEGSGSIRGTCAPSTNRTEDLRLEERTPFYEKAQAIVDTSGKSIEEFYREITPLIQDNGRQSIAKNR